MLSRLKCVKLVRFNEVFSLIILRCQSRFKLVMPIVIELINNRSIIEIELLKIEYNVFLKRCSFIKLVLFNRFACSILVILVLVEMYWCLTNLLVNLDVVVVDLCKLFIYQFPVFTFSIFRTRECRCIWRVKILR